MSDDNSDVGIGFVLGIVVTMFGFSILGDIVDYITIRNYEALTKAQKREFVEWKRGLNGTAK